MLVRESTGNTVGALNAATNAFSCEDSDRIAVQVSGTWAGTIQFQSSLDGTTWTPQTGVQSTATSTTAAINNHTANGLWFIVMPAKYFRVQMTAYTSGTATISFVGLRSNK